MLKGITKIELTDVNTGETRVVEKHNTITGALQELFSPVLGHLTNEDSLMATLPAYTSLLGGLLLFDGKIEGNPLPLFAPDNVKLVGSARYNWASNLGSIYHGSYDANESAFSTATKTAKFVYNFNQSQANGTINSVCLTHRVAGFGVYACDLSIKTPANRLANSIYEVPTTKLIRNNQDRFSNIRGFGENEHLYAIDVDNDVAHYFKMTASNTIVLLKRRIGLRQFSMFGTSDAIVGSPITITLPTGIRAVSSSNNYNSYMFDTETNALYIVSALTSASSITLAAGTQFTVTKVGLGETTATQVTLTNTHNAGILPMSGYVYRGRVYMVAASTTATINGKTADRYPVVSFSLSDGAVSTHGSVTSQYTSYNTPKPLYAADGRLYWQGYYDSTKDIGGLHVTNCVATPGTDNTTLCGVDTMDFITSSSTYYPPSYTPVLNHPMLCYLSFCNAVSSTPEGFFYLAHYLGTVNNLATPIVKAPTQTMKITYTITET